jgi:Tol biopolymer transport system component
MRALRHRLQRGTRSFLLLAIGLSLPACDDPSGPTTGAPRRPPTETPDAPTGANITTTTTGLDIDDGYRVAVDGGDPQAVLANGTTLFEVDTGSRTFSLTGVNENCALTSAVSRTVTVVRAEIVPIEFVVTCTGTRPEPPPRSAILAFESGGDIYVADVDGSHLGRLTSDGQAGPNGLPDAYNADAAWSPGASRIAFSKYRQGGSHIYLIDADGANPTRLSPEGAYDEAPTWSPDGSRIAFVNRDTEGGDHIFVMSANGANRLQLTTNRQPNASPAWSPDGQRIAYVTYSDVDGGGPDIYVMNADGSRRVRVTSDEVVETDPAWSPDHRIVFSRSGVLFVVNADGTNPLRLTPADGSYAPAWSPNGQMIAFTRYTKCRLDPYGEESCRVDIWLLRMPAGPVERLPLTFSYDPSWRP